MYLNADLAQNTEILIDNSERVGFCFYFLEKNLFCRVIIDSDVAYSA